MTREDVKHRFEMNGDKGWFDLVDMIYDYKPDYIDITDVWEKYAALEVRYSGIDESFRELIHHIHYISQKTCQICGRSGGYTSVDGWDKTLCDFHYDASDTSRKSRIPKIYPKNKTTIRQKLAHISVLVDDYDRALDYYTQVLGFQVMEDKMLTETKRWLLLGTQSFDATGILLVKATGEEEKQRIGNQAGGKVFLFLYTDNMELFFKKLTEKKVRVIQAPLQQPWGTVAVIADLYGNLWDIIEPEYW